MPAPLNLSDKPAVGMPRQIHDVGTGTEMAAARTGKPQRPDVIALPRAAADQHAVTRHSVDGGYRWRLPFFLLAASSGAK